ALKPILAQPVRELSLPINSRAGCTRNCYLSPLREFIGLYVPRLAARPIRGAGEQIFVMQCSPPACCCAGGVVGYELALHSLFSRAALMSDPYFQNMF